MRDGPRSVRVFISSTFRDMQVERDELVKRVFPRLRKLCAERGVAWGEVDLRWGITDEQKAEGRVLPVCLEEIRRCRPYFIGLLGERYGWVPGEVDPDLVDREPWLAEHRGRSVTELEIVHGVLNDPAMAEHSFFYLRDPAHVASLPEEERTAFVEGPDPEEASRHGPEEAERRAEERRRKLEALKERIRGSGLPVRTYPDPVAAGELILEDLTGVVDRLFPPGSEPDPLDREAAEHEGYARARAEVYVGRMASLDRLDDHARGDGPPLVVLGESGAGKSALMATWALAHREAHPEDPVVMHFIGSSPRSADWAAMLRRIMGEVARRLGIEGEIPEEAEALRAAFADLLHRAAAGGRVVVVLDALNQLQDRDGAPDLVWLPPVIPGNVRLVVSTLPGRPLEELARRGWPTFEVGPLEPAERRELIHTALARYRKELAPGHAERIAGAPQAANPLFLRVLLEELRLWGEHETLGDRIEHYLAAATIPDLYRLVLERWEADYERERPGLVGEATSLLWAARRGLAEGELLELLGTGGEPLPAAHWSPFSLAAEESLVSRAGLIAFAHDFLRRAVQDAYLGTEAARRAAHLRLADHFEPRRWEPRGVDELPWHLAEAGSWDRLRDLLVEPEFLKRAWEADASDVMGYWVRVEAGSPLRMEEAYRPVVEHPEAEHAWEVAELLSRTGHLGPALELHAGLVDRFRRAGDLPNLARSLGNRAIILKARGDLEGAMALHREEERICRELGDDAGLQLSLGNQALILRSRGDLDGALRLLQEQEAMARALGDRLNLSRFLGNQGANLFFRGDHDGALSLFREQERVCRELGHRVGLQGSLGNQGAILQVRGDLDGATALFEEQERICRELGDRASLQACLSNQARIRKARGDHDGALSLFEEQERICRELGDLAALQSSLGNQAVILEARGDLDGAVERFREKERICRELGDTAGLHNALANLALILRKRGDEGGALALHEEEERLARELGTPRKVVAALTNRASLLRRMGRAPEALPLAEEALGIARAQGEERLSQQVERILETVRAEAG